MKPILKMSLIAIITIMITITSASAKDISVDNRSGAPQVRHAAGRLIERLESLGHTVTNGAADLAITIEGAPPAGLTGPPTPSGPESYSILIAPGKAHIAGSDAVGTMYGIYDIMEQIEMRGASGIVQREKSPMLKLRAVNPFFHIQSFWDKKSWYYDEEYWKSYLDTLSEARYNLLDIHAMYNLVKTNFPNAYLYLLKIDEFPDVGVPEEDAKINLAMFNKIIELADERGIRVSLMSYHASWEMPELENEVAWPSDEQLEKYTAAAVTQIINQCPKLWMVGFRIGESGRKSSFFINSYLKGIKNADREVNMFTRTWAAPVESVLAVADAYPNRTFLEIKYNGEQLGLPYHALTSMTVEYAFTPSYTYEDYLDWPRTYEILWQIRSNGTHRLFRWGDPEFARRAMVACKLGDGAGFTMEPMTAYYAPTDFFHKNPEDWTYFRWDHQRNWFWYHVWGRLSYDPDTPEAVWLNMFSERFGPKAAKPVFDTVVSNSRVVPLIFSYRFMGPDHRDFAPEYENGMSLLNFLRNRPLDNFYLQSCDEFVDGWIQRHPRAQIFQSGRKVENYTFSERMDKKPFIGGRVGPFEFADMLDTYIRESENASLAARQILGSDSQEFNDIDIERRMISYLGGYYADKFRAATHWGLFRKTFALEHFRLAEEYTLKAHENWRRLANLGEKEYRGLLDTLRMKSTNFQWRDEIPKLAEDLEDLHDAFGLWENFMKDHTGDNIALAHVPPYGTVAPNRPLDLYATLSAPADSVVIRLKDKSGAIDYSATLEEIEPGLFRTTIPYNIMKEGSVKYAFAVNAGGISYQFPRKNGKPAAFDLTINSDNTGPAFQLLPLADVTQNSGKIRVRVTDTASVKRVRLYHKPMPTDLSWEHKPMKPVEGLDNVWEAEVELTSHGLLYNFIAEDGLGNAAPYPDGNFERPYLVLDSWRDPAVNPHLK